MYKSSNNFKDDIVKHYKSQGKKVVYIGDGSADYNAAKDADYSFAIEGSRLAELCKNHRVLSKNITDFQKVIEAIDKILLHGER